jgi:predicted transglutaminase-like cysteine proteinase
MLRHFTIEDDVVDSWDPNFDVSWGNKIVGDCDDFALSLYQELIEWYPDYARAFFLTTVFTPNGYHIVVAVDTDIGTYACDNLKPFCRPVHTFEGYRWHLRHNTWADWKPYHQLSQGETTLQTTATLPKSKAREPIAKRK